MSHQVYHEVEPKFFAVAKVFFKENVGDPISLILGTRIRSLKRACKKPCCSDDKQIISTALKKSPL